MIDVCCAASCTWPGPTQPTLCTLCCSSNPVHSVTLGSGGACLLACLEGRCNVSSTVSIVCVRYWSSPPLACYKRTVTLSTSNTRVNFIYFRMYQNTSNIKTFEISAQLHVRNSILLVRSIYRKLITRWDSERELSLRRHCTRTKNTVDSCINSAPDRFLQRRFTNFSEITQCNGHYAVQSHSRSPILVPIESPYTTSY